MYYNIFWILVLIGLTACSCARVCQEIDGGMECSSRDGRSNSYSRSQTHTSGDSFAPLPPLPPLRPFPSFRRNFSSALSPPRLPRQLNPLQHQQPWQGQQPCQHQQPWQRQQPWQPLQSLQPFSSPFAGRDSFPSLPSQGYLGPQQP